MYDDTTPVRAFAPTEHDLSLIAFERDRPPPPRWESLLEDGALPCLVLGAERRTHGKR